MKLFGISIPFWKRKKTTDKITIREVSAPTTQESSTPKIDSIPSIVSPVMTFSQMQGRYRGQFIPPEYNLSEIGIVTDTENMVRQAFEKKLGLMFKEGFEFVGPDRTSIQYIKTRLAQIAQASDIPTVDLLRRLASSLISVSNAFLVKVRNPKASGGKVRKTPNGKTLKPIAGLFPVAPETMEVQIDGNTNKITGWKQILPNGNYKEFAADDVYHFHLSRREGFLFGVPSLIPVIDDIRALRQLEENIELMLYQHLFPLFQYVVGTETAPAGYTEDGRREIDVVKQEIRIMPSEGGIVTPERHEIRMIGAEGRALRAEGYLDYFKKRVVAGLGISSVDLGDGDTTNRATATSMSRALVDSVKSIQDAFESQFNHLVVRELLLESTFNDPLSQDKSVQLKFAEIDLLNKFEQEKHASEMFVANGLTYDEFRKELGREPIKVPEDGEDIDLSQFPEWANTHWKLFSEPLELIRAVDEPYSPQAVAAAQSRSTSLTQGGIDESQKAKEKEMVKQGEIDKQVKKAGPPKVVKKKDSYIETSFISLEEDTLNRIQSDITTKNRYDHEYVNSHILAWAQDNINKLIDSLEREFVLNFNRLSSSPIERHFSLIQTARADLRSRAEKYINKLARDLSNNLKRGLIDLNRNDLSILEIRSIFNSLRYRTRFIWDTELKKASNLGLLTALKVNNSNSYSVRARDGACEECLGHTRNNYFTNMSTIEDIPPFHPSCDCYIERNNLIQNSLEDGTKLERCVLKVKQSLRKRNPSWSEKRIKSSAFAICNSQLNDEKKEGEEVAAECPSCGKTALWQNKSGNYYCSSCNTSFDDPEDE